MDHEVAPKVISRQLGAVIEFKFGPTRAMQPEECGPETKPVAVRDVVRLKQ